MVEKRKRSSTLRETPQAKRHSPTPAGAATPEEAISTPIVPISFSRDGPLPVLPERQREGLSLKAYKSVAESKIMAEALQRSQRKWVDGDVFERFWTKPLKSRKLEQAEIEKNPPKESMAKLGNCTMSCLPHRFEVKLFGVLEPVKTPAAPVVHQSLPGPPPASTSMSPRPPYPPNGAQTSSSSPPPSHPYPPALANSQSARPYIGQPQSAIIPQAAGAQPQRPPSFTAPPPQNPTSTGGHAPNPQNVASRPPGPPYSQPPHPPNQAPQHPPLASTSRPDPVIQLLALKASSDPDLKALMRIVASGKATAEQLKIFQGHIDSLTPASSLPIVPTANGAGRPPGPSPGVPMAHRPIPIPGGGAQQQPQTQQYQQHQQHQHHQQHQQPQHIQQMPYQRPVHYPQNQYLMPQHIQPPKPKPFPQPPKQEITAIVMEFADPYSQGDRFLFPKHTILEYCNGGTMVKASFIVTRKPIDDLDEYFQPITIILESANPKTLEILQKVVVDQKTACGYMKAIMEKTKRAEDSFLVFRLRRDPDEVIPEKEGFEDKVQVQARTIKESRFGVETGTPVRETRASVNTPQVVPSRPRIKTVKKALPKEPSVDLRRPSSSSSSTPAPVIKTPRPPKPPRSRKGRIADPTKSCHICQTSKTSLWRKADIEGDNVTVCNACGIKWKTNTQKQAQIAAAVATGQPLPVMRRGSSAGNMTRPTAQQLESGGPQMPFYPHPGYASQGNLVVAGGQLPYPAPPQNEVLPPGTTTESSAPGYGRYPSGERYPPALQTCPEKPQQQNTESQQSMSAVVVPQPQHPSSSSQIATGKVSDNPTS